MLTTCKPAPPVVLQKLWRPRASSRSFISFAASITAANLISGAGSRSNTSRPGTCGVVRRAIPGMQLEAGGLRNRHQPFDTVDLQVGLSGHRAPWSR